MKGTEMDKDEAIKTCRRWFDHLDRQESDSEVLSRAAALARQGNREEALSIMNGVLSTPRVFDAATLRPAVERLLKEVEA